MAGQASLKTDKEELSGITESEFLRLLAQRVVHDEVEIEGAKVLAIYAAPPFHSHLAEFQRYAIEAISSLPNGRSGTPVRIVNIDYPGILFNVGFYLERRVLPGNNGYSGDRNQLDAALVRMAAEN